MPVRSKSSTGSISTGGRGPGEFRQAWRPRRARYYPLLSNDPTPKIWAPSAEPGYDDRRIPGRKGVVVDRSNGDFYRQTLDAAAGSDPDWILITSWNEWWEHTYIEPSRLYGETYLEITREFANRWKGY